MSSVAVLLERLRSPEFAPKEGVYSNLKIWEETLTTIEAVLSDAEERQLTERAVKIWLDDLKDLFYDMEDILDEIATEALPRKLRTESQTNTSEVRKIIAPAVCRVNATATEFYSRIASKIKEITSLLEQLHEVRLRFGLVEIVAGGSSAIQVRRHRTSIQFEPAIYGRDEDKAKMLEMVLNDEGSDGNFGVISIVGLGGIGKTTLAREVFNDKSVREFFNLRAWVHVGVDFDVLRISKAILKLITLRPCDVEDLDQVQHLLKESLAGRKFMFVLDDVWNEKYGSWEILCSAFMKGAPGSKIIITTRSQNIALRVGCGLNLYELKCLSNEDCWLTFAEQANAIAHPNLKVILKVVEKCNGLPLAARILGGLLHFKERDEWEDVLNSKLWVTEDEIKIFSVLAVSYHYLPSHLKNCFAYCAVLPKDYEFKEKELVLLWMA